MAQIIYTIAAIMILAMAGLNVNLRVHGTAERLMFGEIAMEMTAVGSEVLNEMSRMAFDPGTLSNLLVTTDSLSASSNFGSELCDPDNNYFACFTVCDFHGQEATRTRTRLFDGIERELEYHVTDIEVRYVEVDPPHDPSNDPTFAKEAILTISTPLLVDATGQPFEIRMSRIFTYPMH